uniref:Rusticyanin-like protein n=1 Tax=Acidiphilium symbioticum TaxID=94005 RepID=Q153E1_9PROT|nr:rusticyanin-like protein [Acidiphilium symbioticum]
MGPGLMGVGMMGNYPVSAGWGGKVLSFDDAHSYIQYGNAHGTADTKANSVTFTGDNVVINLVAVQPGYKDQTFELHGLTNPTIIVPRGATVQLNQLNMDYGNNMEHTVCDHQRAAALSIYGHDVSGSAASTAHAGTALAQRR